MLGCSGRRSSRRRRAATHTHVELGLYADRAAGHQLTPDRIRAAFERRYGEVLGSAVPFGADKATFMLWYSLYPVHDRFYNYEYALSTLVSLALLGRRRTDPEAFAAR